MLFKIRKIRIWKVSDSPSYISFPDGSDGKESACSVGDLGSIPGVGKLFWRREWQPIPVVLPGGSHGQRSLVGYSPWDHKELDITEWLTSTHTHMQLKRTRGATEASWAGQLETSLKTQHRAPSIISSCSEPGQRPPGSSPGQTVLMRAGCLVSLTLTYQFQWVWTINELLKFSVFLSWSLLSNDRSQIWPTTAIRATSHWTMNSFA